MIIIDYGVSESSEDVRIWNGYDDYVGDYNDNYGEGYFGEYNDCGGEGCFGDHDGFDAGFSDDDEFGEYDTRKGIKYFCFYVWVTILFLYQFQLQNIIICIEYVISGWEKYSNYCVSDSNQEVFTSEHSEGDDDVEKCQSECILKNECSAIEWYRWGKNVEASRAFHGGVKCFLVLGDIPVKKDWLAETERWQDATCYIKPGNLMYDRFQTLKVI